MDPLNAISLAAAVIQFIDFGSRLLSEAAELYRSTTGQTGQKLDISRIESDLSTLNNEVESKSTSIGTPTCGSSEEIFVRLCGSCQDIANELRDCIGVVGLEVTNNPKRALQSFLIVLRERRSEGKIEALRSKLNQVQQQMMVAVLDFCGKTVDNCI